MNKIDKLFLGGLLLFLLILLISLIVSAKHEGEEKNSACNKLGFEEHIKKNNIDFCEDKEGISIM